MKENLQLCPDCCSIYAYTLGRIQSSVRLDWGWPPDRVLENVKAALDDMDEELRRRGLLPSAEIRL